MVKKPIANKTSEIQQITQPLITGHKKTDDLGAILIGLPILFVGLAILHFFGSFFSSKLDFVALKTYQFYSKKFGLSYTVTAKSPSQARNSLNPDMFHPPLSKAEMKDLQSNYVVIEDHESLPPGS